MIAWINLAVLILASLLFLLYYVRSVSPATLEKVIAFLLHSHFLALFSFIYIPIFLMMCFAEEQDLLVRYGDAYAEYCHQTGAFFPRRGQ